MIQGPVIPVAGDPTALDPSSERARVGVLSTVRTHGLMIVVGLLVGAALGYLGSALLTKQYTAEAKIFFNVEAPFTAGDTPFDDPVRFGLDQAALVQTTEVLQRAGDSLVPPVPVEDVRKSVTAAPLPGASQVTITVVRPDAEQARALANAVATFYQTIAGERVAKVAADAEKAVTSGTGAAAAAADAAVRQTIRLRAAAYGDGVETIEPAQLPRAPSSPVPLQNAILGGLIGLFLVTGVYLVRDQRRARRATVADLDLMIGAPLLARYASPNSRAISQMVSTDTSSDRFRAGHDVLTAVDVALEGVMRPSVLFLSWQNPLSTTALIVSVAVASAREGRPVVLVDGGAKEHGISSLTDVDPGRGLEGLANRNTPVGASLRTWQFANLEMGVVPLSDWSPSLTSAAARPQVLRAAIERLRETAALTLVDGPPLTERSLGLALGRGVDGVVLVIDESTSVDVAQEMGRHIGQANLSVLGYVLVRPSKRRLFSLGGSNDKPQGRTTPAGPIPAARRGPVPDRTQQMGRARA